MGLSAAQFDVIIYGASVSGIIAAADMAEKGKSVLLLNQFGFAGGSITENLNCLQKFDPESLPPATKKIVELISDDMNGYSKNDLSEYILNPESVKIALQNYISLLGINILFHVKACSLNLEEKDSISLELAAKEGDLKLQCRQLVDATEDSTLGVISGLFVPVRSSGNFNIIVSGSRIAEAVSELKPKRYFRISEDRYWISFEVPEASGLSAESKVQAAAERINGVLQKYSSRIQLLPASFQRINQLQRNTGVDGIENFLILTPRVSGSHEPESVIQKAAELEYETARAANHKKY